MESATRTTDLRLTSGRFFSQIDSPVTGAHDRVDLGIVNALAMVALLAPLGSGRVIGG